MITILIITAVFILSLAVLHHQLYYHFRTVDKRKLYRCGQLSQLALWLICKGYKIKTVINLIGKIEYNQPWFLRQKLFCETHGINYFPIPIPPPPKSGTDSIQSLIDELIEVFDNDENYPILVHCKQGVLRTGLVVAIYQKNYCGMDNKTILAGMPNFGHCFQSRRYESFRRFILNYQPAKKSNDSGRSHRP